MAPENAGKIYRRSRTKSVVLLLLFATGVSVYLIWGLGAGCRNGAPPKADAAVREILGIRETCMACHADYAGFAPAHDPKNIGCSPCHLGNPRAADRDSAHLGMAPVPGNFSNVRETCGAANCHGAIAHRVENSLMATMAGIIAVDRFAFGGSGALSARVHVHELGIDAAADVHLRQLCASCHLGNEKTAPAPPGELSRGGGCIACHLDYSRAGEFPAGGRKKFHPAINLQVTNVHCFGCHSRSMRISTNYEGWHETTLPAEQAVGKSGYRTLADGRVFRYISPDVHHSAGLACIDCHSSQELMGDGQRYQHKEDAVKIRCQDCHFKGAPATAGFDRFDAESQKILLLRQADFLDAAFLLCSGTGMPLTNVFLEKNARAVMAGKNSGKRHPLKPPAPACSRGNAHNALTCSACHSAWAPQCVGCHNTFEPETAAFDQLDKQPVKGKWVEHPGTFFAEPPTLGVVQNGQLREIRPFVPGMIMTIDPSGFPGKTSAEEIFHRLFAPASPHTTKREGRSCSSCHNQPLALGYGRGQLRYTFDAGKGRWLFFPEYADAPQDGLPQDAWIGFLQDPTGPASTRPNTRPFSIDEQRKILRVGACLNCHKGNSKVMQMSLEDFKSTLKNVRAECVLPVWD